MRKPFVFFLLLLAFSMQAQQVRLSVTGYRTNYVFTDNYRQYSFDARFNEDGSLLGPIAVYKQVYRANKFDSVLVFRGNYVNGHFADTLTWYYDSGRLMRKAFFKGELPPSVYWYGPGKMEVSGAPDGEVTDWYDQLGNGKQPVKSIRRFENGKQEGLQQEFYVNGQPSRAAEMKNNMWDGSYTEWYSNGKLKEQAAFSNGRMTGKRTLYFENGQVSRAISNSGPNDTITNYYATGKVKDITFYRDYSRSGDYRKFDSITGKVIDYSHYKEDRRDSVRVQYYSSGKKMSVTHYRNGMREGKYECYYENGKTKISGAFSNDSKSGSWNYYDENGKLLSGQNVPREDFPAEKDWDNNTELLMDDMIVDAEVFAFQLPSLNGTDIPKIVKPEDKLSFLKNYTSLEAIATTDGSGKFFYLVTTSMKDGEAEKLESWLNANYGTGNVAHSNSYQLQPWKLNIRIRIEKS